MHKVVIPLSKSKTMLLLAGCALFVVAGYWMFGLDAAEIESQRKFGSPLFVHGIGLTTLVFGGLGLVFIGRKFMDSSPGLVLDDQGLTDNSSVLSGGLIPWPEIAGFEVGQIQRQRILYVLLKDPEKHVSRFGPVKQALLRANHRMAASPVAITSNSLSIGFDDLVALVDRHFAAFRQGA